MRLIDANELEKVMTQDWFLDILLTQTGKSDMAKKLVDLIDSVPLAYDVEKVVECLEEKVELAHKRYVDCPVNSPCYERYRTQYNERRMCLDIVEGGGVNDD